MKGSTCNTIFFHTHLYECLLIAFLLPGTLALKVNHCFWALLCKEKNIYKKFKYEREFHAICTKTNKKTLKCSKKEKRVSR